MTRLKDISFVGTHHSGAHFIDYNVEPGYLKPLFYIARHSGLIKKYLNSWVLTQTKSIKDQLRQGVRLFDMRFGFDRNGHLYHSHTFLGPSIGNIRCDFKNFLEDSNDTSDIVIMIIIKLDKTYELVDISQRKDLEYKLQKKFLNYFEDLLVTNFKSTSQEISDLNNNIILFYHGTNIMEDSRINSAGHYRDGCSIEEIWPNKDSVSGVRDFSNNLQVKEKPESIRFLSFILTPSLSLIIKNLFANSSTIHLYEGKDGYENGTGYEGEEAPNHTSRNSIIFKSNSLYHYTKMLHNHKPSMNDSGINGISIDFK